VPGLDELLGGGLRRGVCALLEGIPGVGKTTLGVQFIVAGAQTDEPGIIVTFEQFPEQLYQDGLNFGWDLHQLEQEDRLRVVCTSPEVFLDQLSDVGGMMDTHVAEIGARRLLVDSVAHLAHVTGRAGQLRPLVYGMLNGIRRAGLTALITKEVESTSPDTIPFEEYLVDTVVRLSYEMTDTMYRQRFIEVVKSRGQDHSAGRHPLVISPRGVRVYPRREPRLRSEEPAPRERAGRSSMGIQTLDTMLCGGLARGYSTLVAGSAGVGKTSLALQFIAAGARAGEPGIFVTFEEDPIKLAELAAGFGIDLATLHEQETFHLMRRSPLHMLPEQFIEELTEEIERVQARRVVVDSLTDMSMSVVDPRQLREVVFVLSEALHQADVTSLYTTEVPELFGQTYVTGEHISIIVDGIILMKYVEMESEIQRAISVLKMRGCDHDKGIWRYSIDGGGIRIRSRFEGTSGVLGGSPVQTPVTLSVRSFTEFDEALNDELLARFAQHYPNVQPVSLTIPYNPDEVFETVRVASQASATSLSVAPLCLYWMRDLLQSQRFMSLEGLMGPAELGVHMPELLEVGKVDDTLYAIPAMALCGVLLYRKDLLEEHGFGRPPHTWEELIEQSRTILAAENDPDLIALQFPGYHYEGLTTSFLQNLWSNGGDILVNGEIALQSPQAVQALRHMYDLIFTHKLAPQNVTTAAHGLEPQADFLAGRTLFLVMLPNVAQACQRESSHLRGKVGLAPHPIGPMGTESVTFLGGWSYGIPVGARAPETASNFIRFMTSYEVQRERSLRGGPLPTIPDLYNDPEVVAFNPDYPLLHRLLTTARKRHDIPHYSQVSGLIQAHLYRVLTGEVEPEAALEALSEEVAFVLEDTRP
jgi:circadian clock protein KaiC